MVWWTLTVVTAAVFFFLALSDAVYDITTPTGPWRILVRKSYSVIAFAILGYFFARALSASGNSRSPLFVALAVALYSALIEITQAFAGSNEGLSWNAIDVGCGFLGGLLGRLAVRRS